MVKPRVWSQYTYMSPRPGRCNRLRLPGRGMHHYRHTWLRLSPSLHAGDLTSSSEIIFFRDRKYFFSPFLSGACILSPWVGTSPPFCTWIQIVIAPGPGHVIILCHLCVERLVLWLLGHELVSPVAQRGVALVSVLQSPLEIVTLTGTGLQCRDRIQ